jgi:myxalamid-type polyketide synthase MxaE and MxaD
VLPTYRWQRERFWSVDTPAVANASMRRPSAGNPPVITDGTPAHFYDALARSRGAAVEESYLTFGLLPRPIPDFSWLLAAFGLASDAQERLLKDGQRSLRRTLLDSVDFERVDKVLDFGCGYGSDLLALAGQHLRLQLHGYTISAEQAEIGAQRLEARGLSDRAHIYHRDSSTDAFPDRYDLIFGFEVATHVRDKQALFANIEHHLRPSGYLLLADFIADASSGIDVADTASYNLNQTGWLDLLSGHHLRIVECIDVSPEVARFLDDPHFVRNLSRVDEEVGLSPIERRNFEAMANFGRALDRKLLRYVLFIVQKDDLARPAYLRDGNRQWLAAPTPYAARTPTAATSEPSDAWLYQIDWEHIPQPAAPAGAHRTSSFAGSTVLIFADPHGVAVRVAQQLTAEGGRALLVEPGEQYSHDGERYVARPGHAEDMARLVDDAMPPGAPPLHAVVHLWSLGTPTLDAATPAALRVAEGLGCAGMLPILRALRRPVAGSLARLWIVTRGAQAIGTNATVDGALAAPLWGMGRTLAVEAPSTWGGLVDLDPRDSVDDAARLIVAELHDTEGEDQVAYRDGLRLGARLVRQPSFEPRAFSLRDDGTYMITGGLGDLGLAAAEWMVARGARYLVLVGRTARPHHTTQALEQLGVRVLVAAADVADPSAMRTVFSQLEAEGWPPLRGVIHAAGAVHQGALHELSDDALGADFRAKVEGSLVLDRLVADAPLDFFVFFSSGSSILGSPLLGGYAAANAFEDALAHARRARSVPALSINWGFWGERGMAVREGGLVPRGMETLSIAQGFAVMERLLGQDSPQVGVLRIDLEAFGRFHPEYARLPLMRTLLGGATRTRDTASSTPRVRTALAAVGPGFRRRSMLEDYLKEQLGQVLKVRTAEITTQTPMQAFGLDSLMAIELRNRLESGFGLTLSATIAFAHPTLAALATHLGNEMNLPLDAAEPTRSTTAPSMISLSSNTLSDDEIAEKLAARLASIEGMSK